MRFTFAHVASLTLLAFAPIALGCLGPSGEADSTTGESNEAISLASSTTIQIRGRGVEVPSQTLSPDVARQVLFNQTKFLADGIPTSDFATVLHARKVQLGLDGNGPVLVRSGARLELQGSDQKVAVEVGRDARSVKVTTADGLMEIALQGVASDAHAEKLAGALAAGLLTALADPDNAAETGRCEAVCVITIGIVVAVGIVAALIAYVVCETSGQDRCTRAAESACGRGNVKSVEKTCGSILTGSGRDSGRGKVRYAGQCKVTCE